ncbi:MAG TPA: HNH endonuclease [Mycobacteriales bacterium]|jgi:putative restriction endonuclease|nr:HNH endonuclease [Mycobacteriales bacterium]
MSSWYTCHVLLDELDVRRAAMAYVAERSAAAGGVVTRTQLEAFTYLGQQLKLIDQSRGIRNPRELAATLTVLSSPQGPYDDVETEDGLLRYAYRSGDPTGGDNRKLRRAAELGLPLILLRAIEAGVFVPVFPVYVVADDPVGRFVEIAVDESLRFVPRDAPADVREYAERLTRLRLHQPVFRARVLRAYETACAVCRLRHVDLLDAAHIQSDTDGGQPVVPNGLALCKIHHAAYDRQIIGVRPDYVVEVRPDVLLEVDGPMLRHGLQDVHGWRLELPSRLADRPDRNLLAQRYRTFIGA